MYKIGDVILGNTSVFLVVKRMCKTSCTHDCYFGKYIDNENHYCKTSQIKKEFDGKTCDDMISVTCCLKKLEGV